MLLCISKMSAEGLPMKIRSISRENGNKGNATKSCFGRIRLSSSGIFDKEM